ncbi:MAG: hypothetical protein IJ385_00875 [Ruminiclostridium sp.]|nr:hypothetical protein [Ruminiclostridium sp.]
MNIIEQIYDEKIFPERKKYSTKGYGKYLFKYLEAKMKIEKKIPPQNISIVHDLAENVDKMECEFGKGMFEAGFSMGMKMAAEIFNKQE